MATTTVARSAQALRHRRDARPSISKRALDSGTESNGIDSKRRKLNEPYVRDSAYILQKHRGKPPSLILHLHSTHFRFDGQDGSFAYDSPMRFVIDHLRKQTVPHDMLEELWAENVPFYDGCLIVEVHNHRAAGSEKSRRSESGFGQDTVKFSMHNYNEHVTPSPLVPYPKRSDQDAEPENTADAAGDDANATNTVAEATQKDGPKITTMVLHPTALSRHHELLLLAHTPASELRSHKKLGESGTTMGGQPPTPSVSVPPTPLSAGGPHSAAIQSQKMCLEESEFYSFQSDLLVATEPPLYLEPAKTPEDAIKIVDMLRHPLHNQRPPSPKIRKRTTAEMAADDAQAAEAERRMLIMDERIKPSARAGAGSAANENQAAAATLGFSRFKTLEMVRQKHEEQERVKKEEEARAAIEKRQNEEHAVQQQKLLQQSRQRELQQQQQQRHNMMMAQQNANRPEQLRLQMEARQQQMAAREHAHPQQNNMVQQNANLQHAQAAAAHTSPVARQQTPLVASSPMLANGGFPAGQTSGPAAGSPARPPSATMQNRTAVMARQASQQQHGSQSNTPQMAQGTPNMAQAIPNRQMAQTPRAPIGSPAAQLQGTPNAANMNMAGQLNPQQLAMLQAQRSNMTQGQNQQTQPQNMTPETIQQIRAQQLVKQQALQRAHQASQQAQLSGADPQVAATNAYRASMMHSMQQQQHRQQQMHQQMQNHMQQQQQQQQRPGGQAGSPVHMQGVGQATPQMGQANPQTPFQQHAGQNRFQGQGQEMTPQQAQHLAQQKAAQLQMQRQQQQLSSIAGQYGGWDNVPPNVISSMNPQLQALLKMQMDKQRLQRQQQMNRVHQTQQNGGDQQVPGNPNPQYMQVLRQNQAALMQMQQQQQQQQQNQANGGMNGMNGMGMNMNMNMNMGNQGNFGNMAGNHDLTQQFADLGRALGQQNTQQRNQNAGQ